MNTLLILIGAIFATLGAASAYVIAYQEYRQRMLRPDQNPRRMAAGTAAVAFFVMFGAAIVLALTLSPAP